MGLEVMLVTHRPLFSRAAVPVLLARMAAKADASGQAALELAGLADAYLPTLAWIPDVDPATTVLVTAP